MSWLTLILAILKLGGVIDVSWLVVAAPAILEFVIAMVFCLTYFIMIRKGG